jgi:hypothetical protein
MRSSASARHIRATPSSDDSEYSWISASTPERDREDRNPSTSFRAMRPARSAASAGSVAAAISGGKHSVSGRR